MQQQRVSTFARTEGPQSAPKKSLYTSSSTRFADFQFAQLLAPGPKRAGLKLVPTLASDGAAIYAGTNHGWLPLHAESLGMDGVHRSFSAGGGVVTNESAWFPSPTVHCNYVFRADGKRKFTVNASSDIRQGLSGIAFGDTDNHLVSLIQDLSMFEEGLILYTIRTAKSARRHDVTFKVDTNHLGNNLLPEDAKNLLRAEYPNDAASEFLRFSPFLNFLTSRYLPDLETMDREAIRVALSKFRVTLRRRHNQRKKHGWNVVDWGLDDFKDFNSGASLLFLGVCVYATKNPYCGLAAAYTKLTLDRYVDWIWDFESSGPATLSPQEQSGASDSQQQEEQSADQGNQSLPPDQGDQSLPPDEGEQSSSEDIPWSAPPEETGGGGCFPGNTLVSTIDSLVPLSSLGKGDKVLGYDSNNRKVSPQQVVCTHVHPNARLMTVTFGKETITCTPRQPFFTGRWTRAAEMHTGVKVLRRDGLWQEVTEEPRDAGISDVHNLEVSPSGSYYVGRSRLLVHNKSITEEKGQSGPFDW